MSNMTTDKPGSRLNAKKPAVKKPAAKKAPAKTDSSTTYVDPVNSPIAQGVPVDDTDARVFEQGRTAALGGIHIEDAPYDKGDDNHKTWLKGHKSITA